MNYDCGVFCVFPCRLGLPVPDDLIFPHNQSCESRKHRHIETRKKRKNNKMYTQKNQEPTILLLKCHFYLFNLRSFRTVIYESQISH